MSEWQPIKTLPNPDTDLVMWNPCDGVHLVSLLLNPRELDEIREGKIYTHWRRLEAPAAVAATTRAVNK